MILRNYHKNTFVPISSPLSVSVVVVAHTQGDQEDLKSKLGEEELKINFPQMRVGGGGGGWSGSTTKLLNNNMGRNER